MDIGHMLIPRQRMADEHGVGFRRVQSAIGLVGDGEGGQVDACVHLQRPVRPEMDDLALGRVDFLESEIVGRSERGHSSTRNGPFVLTNKVCDI